MQQTHPPTDRDIYADGQTKKTNKPGRDGSRDRFQVPLKTQPTGKKRSF